MKSFVINSIVCSCAFAVWADVVHDGPDDWGVPPHPAVVNPVLGSDPSAVISLRGEWEFSPHRMFYPERNNHKVRRFYLRDDWPDVRKIQVPGCWEAQGVGTNGFSDCWDVKWDNNAKWIRHMYMGDGWYRRDVEIPSGWLGRRIWLKVGGVRSVGWFWVNGRQVTQNNKYCGTYKYEITRFVEPGKRARVVVQVNNAMPSRKGLVSAMHRWGGIFRDIEIEATPAAFIDEAWVRGDFDGRRAEVHVEADGVPAAGTQLRVSVEGEAAAVTQPLDVAGAHIFTVPLADFRPWSPESPNLYTAKVELVSADGIVCQVRRERFGVRKMEVRGKEFFLNGSPFFVRGYGDDHVYPMTGVSPADRAYHRAHFEIAKRAGFNYVRLHTHCELPEYFEAADEAGILVQTELPYNADVCCESFAFDPIRDVRELYLNYRRHPSFAVYSMGNEGSFGPELDARLHRIVKDLDPDRLKINQDSQVEWVNPPESADFLGGPINPWPYGSFDPPRPFVCHEYLNLGIKADSRIEPRFTGAWLPPFPVREREEWLAKFGLSRAWGDKLQDAQHVLQGYYQKSGIESARRDPFCDGYCFWTLVDVVVPLDVGVSGQGWLTPFWETKQKGLSPDDFAVFNSPNCLMADLPLTNRVYVSGDTFRTTVSLAHYGETELGSTLRWRLRTPERTLSEGRETVLPQRLGPARDVADVAFAVPTVPCPVKGRFEVALGPVTNSWDIWLFPRRVRRRLSGVVVDDSLFASLSARYDGILHASDLGTARLVVAPYGSRLADEAAAHGCRLLTMEGWNGRSNVELGWWGMGSQVGTAFPSHPCYGDFPNGGYLTPLWFRLVKVGRRLPDASFSERDLVAVGEGGERCYAYLAEKPRSFHVFGLDLLSETPEAASLLDNFIDYTLNMPHAAHLRNAGLISGRML